MYPFFNSYISAFEANFSQYIHLLYAASESHLEATSDDPLTIFSLRLVQPPIYRQCKPL